MAEIPAPEAIVYTSRRGRVHLTWSITLTPVDRAATRVRLRLRLAQVKHPRLAGTVGGLVDLLTILGLAAGLRERVAYAG